MSSVSNNDKFGRKLLRLPKDVEAIIQRAIQVHLYNRNIVTVKNLHQIIVDHVLKENIYREEGEKLPIPSYSTVYQRVKALGKNENGNVVSLKGKIMNSIRMESQYPMQKAVVENVHPNVMVFNEETDLLLGRPWLTIILDSYSMYPLGMYIHFEAPSYQSVMLALKHAMNPKDVTSKYPVQNQWHARGVPETLIVNGSKEFRSKQLLEACHQLNINLEYRPKTPLVKGNVERFFKRLKEEFSEKTHGKNISYKSLQRLIHMWLLDYYSENYNTGVKGVPAVIWREHMQNTPITVPTFEDNLLLIKQRELSITRNGIQYGKLTYLSPDLLKLSVKLEKLGHIKKVLCKYDPSDFSCIYVYDEVEKGYLTVPFANREYIKDFDIPSHSPKLDRLRVEQKRYVEKVF